MIRSVSCDQRISVGLKWDQLGVKFEDAIEINKFNGSDPSTTEYILNIYAGGLQQAPFGVKQFIKSHIDPSETDPTRTDPTGNSPSDADSI
uniref:Protein kintoun n=1 Tax=Talaromyces marneffei PM1 TaxID=1077442 RepID=A0A093VPY4_TALMA